MKRSHTHSLALMALIGALALGFGHLAEDGRFPVREVVVFGELRQVNANEVASKVHSWLGKGFFKEPIMEIRQRLLVAEPWIDELRIERVWPGAMHVRVREHKLLARWGECGVLSERDKLFFVSCASLPEDAPRLYGGSDVHRIMLGRLRTLQGVLWGSGVSVSILRLSERRSWDFKLNNGMSVMLGKYHVDERLQRFTDLLRNGTLHGLGRIETLDLRYPSGFAVRFVGGLATVAPLCRRMYASTKDSGCSGTTSGTFILKNALGSFSYRRIEFLVSIRNATFPNGMHHWEILAHPSAGDGLA
ncbi:MAG: cell division protein FtsQ/DivIB [Candidatus Eutrophobiaceae bacterium]